MFHVLILLRFCFVYLFEWVTKRPETSEWGSAGGEEDGGVKSYVGAAVGVNTPENAVNRDGLSRGQ